MGTFIDEHPNADSEKIIPGNLQSEPTLNLEFFRRVGKLMNDSAETLVRGISAFAEALKKINEFEEI